MALMNWSDYFVTGVDAIDSQHRRLVDLVNQSAPVLAASYRSNPEKAGQLLDELTQYAIHHFQTEEQLMRDHGIDARHYEHHIDVHQRFAENVVAMRQRYESDEQLSGSDLLGFLANWLVFHILGEDQLLVRQIRAIETGESPEAAYAHAATTQNDPAKDALTRALVDLYALMTEQNRHLLEMNHELKSHREHLEEQVSLRTRELAKARDLAEEANRAKSSFVANLSHEIRTPMNAIVGLTWMLHEHSTDPEQRGKLQQVINATQQLLGIINDLLDLSRMESEQLSLEPVNFSPRQLIDHLVADYRGKAEQKGLSLQVEMSSSLPYMVHGDALRISQILSNFVSNAIKFTTTGWVKLLVETTEADPSGRTQWRFAVEDTGIGIPSGQCARLFRPFEQVEQTTRRRFGGTGLGLAISRRLAEMMGGSVGVTSQIDEGSVFWVQLPLTVVNAQMTQAPTTSSSAEVPGELVAGWTGEVPRAHEVLTKLACLLAEDDVQSIPLWRECAEILTPKLGARAKHLEGEILSYNFESALLIVNECLEREQRPD